MTTRTEEDREFAAITPQEIWEEARDRLKIATDADSDNRRRAQEAILFREGDQWEANPSVGEDEIELTINLTDAMCERVENNIRQQRPRGKVHPVGDGANVEIAEIINGIGRHIETRSEASIAYDTAAAQALDGGFGYFRLIAEYVTPRSFQKDLRILPIRNQFSVSMDPSAIMPHGGDQNWCIISTKMPRQEYRRKHGSTQGANWAQEGDYDLRSDWEGEEIRLAEYFRVRERSEKLYQFRDGQGHEFTKYLSEMPRDPATGKPFAIDAARAMLAERGYQITGERDSTKRQVEWFRLNGLRVVERQQIPGSYIPVFRVEGRAKDIGGKVRRRGMVETMMDAQRMVNYGEVAKIKRLGLTPKAPWVTWEGQLDGHPEWDDANTKAYSVLTIKPVVIETSGGPVLLPAPQRQAPAQIEQGFSEFVQGMRSNLMSLAGMPNEPGQDPQGGEAVSGIALRRRQFLSDQSHYRYYDNLTIAIAQLWRVMVEWIPVYFSEERMQRIIGEDSTPEMVELNKQGADQDDDGVSKIKNDLSVGTYDVVMDTGPGYDTKREEGADNLIGLMKVGPLAEIIAKTAPDLVFRSIDHPYMQELADRLMATTDEGLTKVMESLPRRAKDIVLALQKELQAMKQQNQTLEQDLKAGLTKAHLDAVTKAHGIDVQARTKIHDTDSRDRTHIDVAEINTAGRMMDSEAERRHGAAQTSQDLMHAAHQAVLDRQFQSGESAADRIMKAADSDQNPAPSAQ